jgi:hypothetical protein
MELVVLVQTARDHVRIADRLDFVNVQEATIVVEIGVQAFKHFDDFDGLSRRANGREAHNVTVEQGDIVHTARFDSLATPELLSNVAREYQVEQFDVLALLLVDVFVRFDY